jgi:hypothetical protein
MTQPEASLEQREFKDRLWKARVVAMVVAALLACSLIANWMIYQRWSVSKILAKRNYEIGYLAARIDLVRDTLVMPGLTEINFAITRLEATSAQLGFPNPDTLRYYGIKPWEDYFATTTVAVADQPNWTKRRAR